ncbi:MAG TPA: hypothetical protein VE800_07745 [Actinomycetota bacterium]|nr:hypothetical protein [Actinomycetota bacterium]
MIVDRSHATTPWLYHDEYAIVPRTSVLCTDQMPRLGGVRSPIT